VNADVIKAWLKKKKTSGAVLRGLMALLAFLAGVVVLFLTFWFTYAIVYIGCEGISAVSELAFSKRLRLSHEWRLAGSGLFLVLLFIQHFRTRPWHWGDYPKRDYVAAPALQYHAGAAGGLAFMLAYPGASANMVADILLSGPRLVTGAWNLWRESMRLARLDEARCAELIAFLSSCGAAVPYDELRNAGWEDWFGQLRSIEGVLFLEKGLGLSGELRKELSEFNGN
jgi:hypothetical protein